MNNLALGISFSWCNTTHIFNVGPFLFTHSILTPWSLEPIWYCDHHCLSFICPSILPSICMPVRPSMLCFNAILHHNIGQEWWNITKMCTLLWLRSLSKKRIWRASTQNPIKAYVENGNMSPNGAPWGSIAAYQRGVTLIYFFESNGKIFEQNMTTLFTEIK